MKVRRGIVGSALAAGLLVVAGSVASACVSTASTPYMGDVVPNRVPVLAGAQVSGGGWAAEEAVTIGFARSPHAEAQPLAVATPDRSGNVAPTTVTVPDVAPGFYYLVATQASTVKAVPFEVLGSSGTDVAAAPDDATPASGQNWSGLRADGTTAQGLADLPASPKSSSSSMVPMVALALGASAILGGLVMVELRRRKVHANSEVRDIV